MGSHGGLRNSTLHRLGPPFSLLEFWLAKLDKTPHGSLLTASLTRDTFHMHNQGLRPRGDLSERDPRILEHPQLLAEMSVHDNPAFTGTPGLAGTTGTSASEPPSDMDQLKRQTLLLTKRMEELTALISGSLSMAGRPQLTRFWSLIWLTF